jgi:hypothetical protein
MYRIEVAPGEETVFRTIEELAIGIRNGVITQRARIYHNASQKWLPIALHPHYKKALEMPAASASPASVTVAAATPTPSRPKAHPTASPAPSPAPSPAAHSQPQPHSLAHLLEPKLEPKRAPEPKATPEPTPGPMTASAVTIPAPVPSPVVAMQNEVLRDLPVISIPEPLPWTVKPAQAAPPVEAYPPPVFAPEAHAPTYAPATHAPMARAPKAHAPVAHAPVAYAPQEITMPVAEPQDANADGPMTPHSIARRPRRMGGRPVMLFGAAAALVIFTHLALTATPSASADASEAPASRSTEELETPAEVLASERDRPAAATNSIASRAAETPRVTIAPARVPMTPGPAFAGSVPALPRADSATTASATAPEPASVPAPSIAPAPAALELALPDLPPDSVVSAPRTGDTVGMKRILRALNGAKSPETTPAP